MTLSKTPNDTANSAWLPAFEYRPDVRVEKVLAI